MIEGVSELDYIYTIRQNGRIIWKISSWIQDPHHKLATWHASCRRANT